MVRFAVAVALVSMMACPTMAMARRPSPVEVQLLQGRAPDRLAAAKKLALEKDPATAETLTKALKDDEPLVKRFASYGLQRIGNPAAAPAIEPLLKDKDEWVRRTAATALGKLGAKSSVPALLAALKDESLLVRLDAFAALSAIGNPGSQQTLVAVASDPRIWSELAVGDQRRVLQMFDRPFLTAPSVKELLVKLLDYGKMSHPELDKLDAQYRQGVTQQIANAAACILATKFHDASGVPWLVEGVGNLHGDFMVHCGPWGR